MEISPARLQLPWRRLAFAVRAFAGALSYVSSAGAADTLAGNAAWIDQLKCGALVVPGDRPNPDEFPKFSVWFMGFSAGIATLPVEGRKAPSVSMRESLALVLTTCAQHPDWPAVRTAVDVVSFEFNAVNTRGETIELLEPPAPIP